MLFRVKLNVKAVVIQATKLGARSGFKARPNRPSLFIRCYLQVSRSRGEGRKWGGLIGPTASSARTYPAERHRLCWPTVLRYYVNGANEMDVGGVMGWGECRLDAGVRRLDTPCWAGVLVPKTRDGGHYWHNRQVGEHRTYG